MNKRAVTAISYRIQALLEGEPFTLFGKSFKRSSEFIPGATMLFLRRTNRAPLTTSGHFKLRGKKIISGEALFFLCAKIPEEHGKGLVESYNPDGSFGPMIERESLFNQTPDNSGQYNIPLGILETNAASSAVYINPLFSTVNERI